MDALGPDEELDEEEKAMLAEIKTRKARIVAKHRVKKTNANNAPAVPRKFDKERRSTISQMKQHMEFMGMDATGAVTRAKSRSQSRVGRKRGRDVAEDMEMDEDDRGRSLERKARSRSRVRSPTPGSGIKDVAMAKKALKVSDRMQRGRNKLAKKGEGDRHIPDLKPKHLFSGKRGIGKTDRR